METGRLKTAFGLIVLVLTAAWAASLPAGTIAGGFWPLRQALLILTGILAIGFMSCAVVLAARPVQIERLLGGLDKYYRLHKWLGVGGASLGIVHWLIEIGPRGLVHAGWVAAPQRGPRPPAAPGFDFFADLHHPAAEVGEPALYLLLILVAVALWKRFPYRYFFKAHRLLAALYLVLVFHSVVLLGPDYWAAPAGPVLGLVMAAGSVGAFLSLFRRIGAARRAVGTVERLSRHDGTVLEVGIKLSTAWPGHKAGQFAFLDLGGDDGPHPFTIASAWHRDGRLTFGIKGLGDFTRALPEQLFIGQTVTVEGPYGLFDFTGPCKRQIWIAGGVGVTPFVAGLEHVIEHGTAHDVDFIYSTAAPIDSVIERLRHLAGQAGVRFHLMVAPRDGLLTLDRLEAMVPDWRDAETWFCGPAGFGRGLRTAMVKRGFDAGRFHQERFEMR